MGMDSYLFKADQEHKHYEDGYILYLRRSSIVHNWMVNNAGPCDYNEEVTLTEDQLRALETYLLQYLIGHRVYRPTTVEEVFSHHPHDGQLECWHIYEIRETITALWSVLDPIDNDGQLFTYRAD